MRALVHLTYSFVLVFCAIALLLAPKPLSAQSPVEDCSDDTELRADIAVSQVVTFTCGPAIISLSAPLIIEGLSVIDAGDVITFSGGNQTNHFEVSGYLQLSNIALVNGRSQPGDPDEPTYHPAGSIYATGGVQLENVRFEDNSSDAKWGASVLYLGFGQSTLMNVTIRNSSGSAYGVIVSDSKVYGDNLLMEDNRAREAGAIVNRGELKLVDSLIHGNSATAGVGAILTLGYPTGNYSASLNLERTTIAENDGPQCGALQVQYGSVSAEASSIIGNHSEEGAAVCVHSANGAFFSNSTLSGNSGRNGALWANMGWILIFGSTVAYNQADEGRGGGMTVGTTAGTTIQNSIVAHNSPQDCLNLSETAVALVMRSVVGDESCLHANQVSVIESVVADPLLAPLALNGGSTLNHLPAADSPAIDLAPGNCSPTDQRGTLRWYGACDAGSVEVTVRPPVFLPVLSRPE